MKKWKKGGDGSVKVKKREERRDKRFVIGCPAKETGKQ
jgi:hypothetical protein